MAPPANQLPANAINVTTFPYTNTQSDIADGVDYWEVWYHLTAPADARMISVWGRSGNTIPTGYLVQTTPYSDAGFTQYASIVSRTNLPIQIHVTSPSQEFWVKFAPVSAFVSAEAGDTLTIGMEVHEPTPIVEGDLLVNHDINSAGFPTAVFSKAEDYVVKKYLTEILAAGEGGDCLTSGILCFDNAGTVILYNVDLTILFTSAVLFNDTTDIRIRRDTASTQFWMTYGHGGFGNTYARTLSPTGTLGAETELVGIPVSNAIAADSTYLYLGAGYESPIYRWNIAGATLASNLAAAISFYEVEDILALSDGTFAVLYLDTSAGPDTILVHYSASGTLLNSYNLGVSEDTVPRMCWALDNPSSVWVMDHRGGETLFFNVRLTDGFLLVERHHGQYDQGQYQGAYVADPVRFGQANCCPIVMVETALADEIGGNGDGDGENGNGDGEEEPPLTHPGGIYYIFTPSPPESGTPPSPPTIPPGGTDTHHDEYNGGDERKIPNPTIRTALFGE